MMASLSWYKYIMLLAIHMNVKSTKYISRKVNMCAKTWEGDDEIC